MQKQRFFGRFILLTTTLVALALAGTSFAQMGQQGGTLEQEFMQLQERLQSAQQRAIENNPALQEQIDTMEDLVTEKMREAGYDPGGIMETLLAAQGQLQDERLSDAQRREILESREVREAQQQLHEAQQAVMQEPEVADAQRSLEASLMEAMRREEPDADRMIERIQEIQREAQRRMR